MKALRELEVRSPLRECGLTKEEIRKRSKDGGLFTWDKPAYACLATRIPTGTKITGEDLHKVEKAEAGLAELGFADFRVRLFQKAAKIQVTEDQLPLLLEKRETALERLQPWFSEILLDLNAREPSR